MTETESQLQYLETPEEIILFHEYQKYQEVGDLFFPDGLSFERWKATRDRLLGEMCKFGTH